MPIQLSKLETTKVLKTEYLVYGINSKKDWNPHLTAKEFKDILKRVPDKAYLLKIEVVAEGQITLRFCVEEEENVELP